MKPDWVRGKATRNKKSETQKIFANGPNAPVLVACWALGPHHASLLLQGPLLLLSFFFLFFERILLLFLTFHFYLHDFSLSLSLDEII